MAEKIILFEADVDTDAAVKDTIRLKEELEVLRSQAEKARKEQGELSAEYIKYQAAIKSTQSDIKIQENLTQKLTGANAEQAGTLTKLTAENAKLRQEQRGLNLETKAGIDRNKEINAKINENTDFIKKNSDSLVQNKMSVGGYADALEKAGAGQAGVIQGFLGMAKAAWAFIATPIGAVIAAIVVVFTVLYDIFKKFDPIVDKIQQAFTGIVAVLSVLKNAILSFITGAKSLTESFGGLGDSMSKAYDEGVKLKKIQQELDDMNWLLIESEAKSKRQIDELLLQSKDRSKSEKERMALIDEALKIEEEAFQKKKAIADQEYEIAVGKIALNNDLTELEIKNLREKGVQYAIDLKDTKALTDDEVKMFADATAKKEQILNESINLREKAINRQNALLEKQQADEEKRNEKLKADAEKKAEEENKAYEKALSESEKLNQQYLDAQQKAEELRRQFNLEVFEKGKEDRQKQREYERDRLAIDLDNELQLRILNNESKFNIERDLLSKRYNEELSSAKKTGADTLLIQRKYSLEKRKLEVDEINSNLQARANFAGAISELFGKQTAIGRVAASAQTLINTYLGAQAAFAQTPGGILIKTAAAALATAIGLKNLKNINAVKSGLPGDSGQTMSSVSGSDINKSIGNGIVNRNVSTTQNRTTILNQPTLVIDKVTSEQQQEDRRNDTSTI